MTLTIPSTIFNKVKEFQKNELKINRVLKREEYGNLKKKKNSKI